MKKALYSLVLLVAMAIASFSATAGTIIFSISGNGAVYTSFSDTPISQVASVGNGMMASFRIVPDANSELIGIYNNDNMSEDNYVSFVRIDNGYVATDDRVKFNGSKYTASNVTVTPTWNPNTRQVEYILTIDKVNQDYNFSIVFVAKQRHTVLVENPNNTNILLYDQDLNCGHTTLIKSSNGQTLEFDMYEFTPNTSLQSYAKQYGSLKSITVDGEAYDLNTDQRIFITPHPEEGRTTYTLRLSNIVADHYVQIEAGQSPMYDVTVATSNANAGTVMGSGRYASGEQVKAFAIPMSGYTFQQWSNGSTANPLVVSCNSAMTLTAQFAPAQGGTPSQDYTLSVMSANNQQGLAAGNGSFAAGTNVEIAAIAMEGYHFTNWNDGNTQNPRIVTVNSNATYIANFSANLVGINNATDNSYTVSAEGHNIVLRGAANRMVRVFDNTGRQLFCTTATEEQTFAIHTAGTYFVQVDRNAARKVTVVR